MEKFCCTPECIYKTLMDAWMSCTFGNTEPPLIKMGKGFSETISKGAIPIIFNSAVVVVDERMDNWLAQIFMWDKASYEQPILFVGATVKIVDGQ